MGLTPEAIRQGEMLFDALQLPGPGHDTDDYREQRKQFVKRLAAFVQAMAPTVRR